MRRHNIAWFGQVGRERVKLSDAASPPTCRTRSPLDRLLMNTWTAHKIDDAVWLMESEERNVYVRSAHCLACAYADVVTEYGGNVNLRGLYSHSRCYSFLRMLVLNGRSNTGLQATGETRGLFDADDLAPAPNANR